PYPRRQGIADYIKTFVFYASELMNADSIVVIRVGVYWCRRAEQTQSDADLVFTGTRRLCTIG
ncbi:MAG: hypothetical protein ACM3TN_08600, partial [Alphaproteobacteria bacterium]